MILDEDPEPAVNGDVRQPRVARLLQAFDQQRTVTGFGDHVRVEVVALDAARVRQDDPPDAERRELCP